MASCLEKSPKSPSKVLSRELMSSERSLTLLIARSTERMITLAITACRPAMIVANPPSRAIYDAGPGDT